MRKFINFFIILYVVDAVYSLVDELLIWSGMQMPLLTSIRMMIAVLVVLMSLVVYACLGVDRRLPKIALLLMTVYISWCSLGLWPLSGIVERELLPLYASMGQVAVVVLVAVLLRGQLLLPEEMFQQEYFSMSNTLWFTGINLVLTPFLIVYCVLAVFGTYLEEQTAGFLRVSPIGIYMAERSYHLDDKEIRLAGMMHIGRGDYYEDLVRSLPVDRAIILAEGVTDRDELLTHDFKYNRIANALGLDTQESMRIDANPVDLGEVGSWPSRVGGKPDIALADIDINRFNPHTVEFLNLLGRTLLGDRPLIEAFEEYNTWVSENMTPENFAGVMNDILNKRNEAIVASMQKTINSYDMIIIPWGALHMPEIERAVLEQGFRPGTRTERLSLDFSTVPYREIWQEWLRGYSGDRDLAARY